MTDTTTPHYPYRQAPLLSSFTSIRIHYYPFLSFSHVPNRHPYLSPPPYLTTPPPQTFKGSIQFMAPERLMGQRYGAPSDVWGLGVSLFRFLTGEFPHGKARSYWSIVDVLVNERRLCLCKKQCGSYLYDFVNQVGQWDVL